MTVTLYPNLCMTVRSEVTRSVQVLTALQAHFFQKVAFWGPSIVKWSALKKIQSPRKNLKGRTLYDLLHEGLMRRTARSPHFTLLLQVYAFMSSF